MLGEHLRNENQHFKYLNMPIEKRHLENQEWPERGEVVKDKKQVTCSPFLP